MLEEREFCEILVVGDQNTIQAGGVRENLPVDRAGHVLGDVGDRMARLTEPRNERRLDALIRDELHAQDALPGMISSMLNARRA